MSLPRRVSRPEHPCFKIQSHRPEVDLRFYYDIVCPYAYLASTRVQALADEASVPLAWCPILLGGVLQAHGSPTVPMDEMPPPKARFNHLDALRQAERLGVPLRWHPDHPRRTVDAMRLVLAAPEAERPAVSAALYRAYWVEGRDVADRAVLAAVGQPWGLDPERVRAEPAIRQALFDAGAEAVERGVFGVPSLEVDGVVHWGVDRLPVVRRALGLPPEPPATRWDVRGAEVVFFHDFSSPYSYLASTRIDAMAADRGATVSWVPMLLGAVFHAIGTPTVPLDSFSPARRAWADRDIRDQAALHGVPLRWPSQFPLRTVAPLRVAIVAPETTPHLYRAAWVDDRDIGEAETLREVLDDAGFDGASLVARTREPEVKALLRRNTERAVAAGVCGAPSFQVGDLLFWGQDRLDMVGDALGGWRPTAG